MSIPPSASRPGVWYSKGYGLYPPYRNDVNNVTVQKRIGSSPVKTNVPLQFRTKTWVYRGRVYSRTTGYRPKTFRITSKAWREPKPYRASLEEGDLTHFNGYHKYYSSVYDPAFQKEEYGDLPRDRYVGVRPAIPGFDPGLESRAVIKALAKLKDQKVNLAVAFGERHETAKLLVSTLSGLTKAARSLRHGDMRGVAKGLGLRGSPKAPRGQTFPQKWLELQYGWLPLYSDVYGATAALNEADRNTADRYAATVTGKVGSDRSSNTPPQYRNYGYSVYTVNKEFEGAFCRLDYFLENPFLASLSSLGITNPLEVAWELVPFSFVADWFYPVGNYLSSLDAALGWKFRGGSLTRLFRREHEAGLLNVDDGKSWFPNGISTWGAARIRQMAINRTVYSSSPLPRIPSFKNPFPQDGRHIANAIALFASSLRP